ncbi:hypothetical protein D3C80_1551260 [compost metagenome]
MDKAASTTPRGTSSNDCSTSLAYRAMDTTASGTEAAKVPIAVPTMSLVSGIMNTTSSKKGNDRITFTAPFKTAEIVLFSYSCPFPVKKRSVPAGSPSKTAAATDIPTITKVSPIDSAIWDRYCTTCSTMKEKSNTTVSRLPKQMLPI